MCWCILVDVCGALLLAWPILFYFDHAQELNRIERRDFLLFSCRLVWESLLQSISDGWAAQYIDDHWELIDFRFFIFAATIAAWHLVEGTVRFSCGMFPLAVLCENSEGTTVRCTVFTVVKKLDLVIRILCSIHGVNNRMPLFVKIYQLWCKQSRRTCQDIVIPASSHHKTPTIIALHPAKCHANPVLDNSVL